MNLRDLNATVSISPNGMIELMFDCPKCGSPYRVHIHARRDHPPTPGIWNCTKFNPQDVFDGLTLTPSIIYGNHGKKKLCGWHGNVAEGEVTTV